MQTNFSNENRVFIIKAEIKSDTLHKSKDIDGINPGARSTSVVAFKTTL